jgi:hypothetical protein
MAWRISQTKSGTRRVYSESQRVGHKVKTLYYREGPWAERAAREQQQRHEARRARRQALDQQRQLGAGTYRRIEVLLRAAMTAAGYYRHYRGPWRRRRYTQQEFEPALSPSRDLAELVGRANSGRAQALAALRKF